METMYIGLDVHKMKNKIAVLLVEAGVIYNERKSTRSDTFVATNQDINEGLKPLLRLCRETVVRLGKTQSALVRSLATLCLWNAWNG